MPDSPRGTSSGSKLIRTKEWSPVETRFLIDNFRTLPITQLSIELGRSERVVRNQAARLDLADSGTKYHQTNQPVKTAGSKSAQGYREDLGMSMRSPWEANVARWLTSLGVSWLYEPHTFEFPAEVRGTRTYTPDFFLPELGVWLEVKGHLNSQGRSKLKKLSKYHPDDFARLLAIPGTNRSQSAKWFVENGVRILAFYSVLRYDNALEIPHWEQDATSSGWATSKRKRNRPDDFVIHLPPRKRRKKGPPVEVPPPATRKPAASKRRVGARSTLKRAQL